jgi:hypothetical protein
MSVREPGVQVEFEQYPVLLGFESKQAGREIYQDEPHVRIRVAGQDKSEFFGPVTAKIKARFPEEWAAFERGMEAPMVGTPIEQWGRITPSMRKQLHLLNVRTVEDIASMSDDGLQKLGMGARQLQNDARKFLSLSQSSADLARLEELEKSNKEKDEALRMQGEQLAALGAQVAQLMAKQEAPEEEAPRKRTRKEAQAA